VLGAATRGFVSLRSNQFNKDWEASEYPECRKRWFSDSCNPTWYSPVAMTAIIDTVNAEDRQDADNAFLGMSEGCLLHWTGKACHPRLLVRVAIVTRGNGDRRLSLEKVRKASPNFATSTTNRLLMFRHADIVLKEVQGKCTKDSGEASTDAIQPCQVLFTMARTPLPSTRARQEPPK
jgi:hypothetical protein